MVGPWCSACASRCSRTWVRSVVAMAQELHVRFETAQVSDSGSVRFVGERSSRGPSSPRRRRDSPTAREEIGSIRTDVWRADRGSSLRAGAPTSHCSGGSASISRTAASPTRGARRVFEARAGLRPRSRGIWRVVRVQHRATEGDQPDVTSINQAIWLRVSRRYRPARAECRRGPVILGRLRRRHRLQLPCILARGVDHLTFSVALPALMESSSKRRRSGDAMGSRTASRGLIGSAKRLAALREDPVGLDPVDRVS